MRFTQAPHLFNGAVSDALDIAEAMPAYCTAETILGLDKAIADFERAVATMRDCYNTVKLGPSHPRMARGPINLDYRL